MSYHHLFQNRYTQWSELETLIESLVSAQEKGEVFEQFVFAYLILNKDYYQIKDVYRANNIPTEYRKELSLEPTDYGVDGIFILNDGTIAAYQAKFRSARGTATVRELATFWSEAEKASHKYVIANATQLPRQAGKHSYSVLADTFDELDQNFFDLLFTLATTKVVKQFTKASPDAHQIRMIDNTIQGFSGSDRGKLIAACGVGKTLTSLWIIEAMNASTVLILVPSLALIKQTLESWSKHKEGPFSYLCVCSDASVVDAKELDYGEYELSEVDFPVTTDKDVIAKFLLGNTHDKKYIFSTYNSAQSIADAMPRDFSFDLIIFDEAHRTAGQKDSNLYSLALYDSGIMATKRLFMTATERLIKPWVVDKAAEAERIVYSMDDEKIYGKEFDRYTFGEAIQDGVISDYKIVLTAITANEVERLIQENRLIIAEGDEKERHLTAQNIYKQAVLHKAMKQFDIRKTITFHSNVKRAKSFVNGSGSETYDLKDLYSLIWPEIASDKLYFDWVDGTMATGLRKQKLKDFANSDIGIIANAKCLTEGVDVPIIDSIYFVDPKTSLVDIVQACGRALRKSRNSENTKTAYFIVPIIITEQEDDSPELIDTGKFETLLNLVQALRNQDERMADWIDKINLRDVRGGGNGEPGGDESPLVINFPQEFDLSAFTNQIQVRIYEGVKGPTIQKTDLSFNMRRSDFRKDFKAIGDYNFQAYISSNVTPTIERFNSPEDVVSSENIKVSNNNVSHTFRLGLIEKTKNGDFILTQLGKELYNNLVDTETIFQNALLGYNCKKDGAPLYPYIAALKILSRVNSVNKVEFLYGIYSLRDSSSESIDKAVERINMIRKEYPNVTNVNDANKTVVLDELNEKLGEDFSKADLWASTTATNKYGFFKNHLSIFEGINTTRTIEIVPDYKQELLDLVEAKTSSIDYSEEN